MRALLLASGALYLYYLYTRKNSSAVYSLFNEPFPFQPSAQLTIARREAVPVNWSNLLSEVFTVPTTPQQPAKPVTVKTVPRYWVTPANGLPYEPLFLSASKKYGLPSGLLSRIAYQESRYNPKAYNKGSTASGMMQIVPRWHPGVDPFNVNAAIPYAASYLAQLHRLFPGSWDKAIASYNWGQGNIAKVANTYGDKWLDHVPDETYSYVKDVMRDTGLQ